MQYDVHLYTFLVSKDKLLPAGTAHKHIEHTESAMAEAEARDWVRRNRASNPDVPVLYKVELYTGGKMVYHYDETAGQPLLEPNEYTTPSCQL